MQKRASTEKRGEVASAPAGSGAVERPPGLGRIPILDPAFGEGATVEKMRQEGVEAGVAAACFFPPFPGAVGAGLV